MTIQRSHTSRLRILLLLGAATLLGACSWLQIPVNPGGVLFQDDFSLEGSGWDRYRDDIYVADYAEGGYHIRVSAPNTDAWATPHLNFGDVAIDVDATKLAGPDDNVFGVICRYQDPLNYYFFLVSSDGYAGIGVNKEGRRKLLTGDSLLPSPVVARGDTENHLRAECVGYNLALYVNGALVAQARAAEWPTGDVGLIAGTYAESGTEIRFDNFSVLRP